MLNGKIKEVKFDNVILEEPGVLKCTKDGEDKFCLMGKSAINFIYSRIDLSYSMCKKLFYSDKDMWISLRDKKLIEREEIKPLKNYRYMMYDNFVFAMIDEDFEDISVQYDLFDEAFKNAKIFVNANNNIQLINKKVASDGRTSLILVDFNLADGYYVAFNGLITDEGYYITPTKPIVESFDFYEFMRMFDPSIEISMSEKLYNGLLSSFLEGIENNVELSVREVLNEIKGSNCKIELTPEGYVASLDLVGSENLVEFLNSFEMPFKSLKKLGWLRKSLTYGNFTFKELLLILSKNYESESNAISAWSIALFLRNYYNGETDKNISKEFTK